MPHRLTTEYDIDTRKYLDRIEEIITERHPPAEVREVEEVLFADGGPVDYLAWFALEGYEDHTFFYYDDSPDSTMLQQLLSVMPNADEMHKLRALLREQYETFEVVETAYLFEIPDTYLPQFTPRPRANLGFFYSPVEETMAAGISGVPRTKEEKIVEDVGKLLPSKSVERFVNEAVRELYDRITTEIERHVLEGEICPRLESDPDFRHETVSTVPDDLHPEYEGVEAELWQKPVSRVPYIDGSQGFLQVWLPVEADAFGLVTLTSGGYDEEAIVEQTRDRFLETVQ
jgi:hypothetical protein